jgi:hypothetical protein
MQTGYGMEEGRGKMLRWRKTVMKPQAPRTKIQRNFKFQTPNLRETSSFNPQRRYVARVVVGD